MTHRNTWTVLLLVFVLSLVGLSAADNNKDNGNSGGGLLGSMLGGTIRRGLGLSAGDFAEFTLDHIRIVNARMAAPAISQDGKSGNTDTTFLQVDEILVEYSPLDVLNKRILKRVVIDRPQIWVSQLSRKLEDPNGTKKPAAKDTADKPSKDSGTKLIIQRLELKDVEVYVDTLRTQGLNIPLRFAQKDPIVLEQLSIDDLLHHPGAEKLVTVDADQVMIHSAYGPMAPLISIGKLEIGFTWKGLFNKELESLVLSDPSLYIGDDWFLLLKEFKQNAPETKATPAVAAKKVAEDNFMVKKFRIERLRLTLSSFGVLKMVLPFSFNYDAENIGLDQNGRFFLNSQLKVNETAFQMPEYNLAVDGLDGDIKFNWPPVEGTPDNIVPTLKATTLTMKDLQLTNPWASLTFVTDSTKTLSALNDKPTSKAYLAFGTDFYGGYLKGNIESDFSQKWQANFTGTDVNIQAINAFRSQPIQGVFQLKLDAEGTGGAVDRCDIDLVNARGISMNSHLSGKIRNPRLSRTTNSANTCPN
jgi:hypothetical protein